MSAAATVDLDPTRRYEYAVPSKEVTLGVAFPGMDAWNACRELVEPIWTGLFEGQLTPSDYAKKYGPYDQRSIMIYARQPDPACNDAITLDTLLGATQLIPPLPGATTIYEAGLKTVMDATDPDPEDPWGGLHFSADAKERIIDRLRPEGCHDVLIHLIHRRALKLRLLRQLPRIDTNAGLESMQAGLVLGHFAVTHTGIAVPEGQIAKPVIITNLVSPYLGQSEDRYNIEGATADESVHGVVRLGDAVAYGADPHDPDKNGWTTAVMMDIQAILKVDEINTARANAEGSGHHRAQRLDPELFIRACPLPSYREELKLMRGALAA